MIKRDLCMLSSPWTGWAHGGGNLGVLGNYVLRTHHRYCSYVPLHLPHLMDQRWMPSLMTTAELPQERHEHLESWTGGEAEYVPFQLPCTQLTEPDTNWCNIVTSPAPSWRDLTRTGAAHPCVLRLRNMHKWRRSLLVEQSHGDSCRRCSHRLTERVSNVHTRGN